VPAWAGAAAAAAAAVAGAAAVDDLVVLLEEGEVDEEVGTQEVRSHLRGGSLWEHNLEVVGRCAALLLEPTPHLSDLRSCPRHRPVQLLASAVIADVEWDVQALGSCSTTLRQDAAVPAAGIRRDPVDRSSVLVANSELWHEAKHVTVVLGGAKEGAVGQLGVQLRKAAAAGTIDGPVVGMYVNADRTGPWLRVLQENFAVLVSQRQGDGKGSHLSAAEAFGARGLFEQVSNLRNPLRSWLPLLHVAGKHLVLVPRLTPEALLQASSLRLLHADAGMLEH